MRALFDIVHPAHVHFYRYMLEELMAAGNECTIVSRDKDIAEALLDHHTFDYLSTGKARIGSRGLAIELLVRDLTLLRIAREFKPDVILTRNPSGTHIGKALRVPSVFDTDNGRSAGTHYRIAAPFASFITTPDCFPDDLGKKQVRYPSYKPLAYLHPDRFKPDATVRHRLGVTPDQIYFIIRLVSMAASHDLGQSGMPLELVINAVDLLRGQGRVFVSSESVVPPELNDLQLPTSSADFHNVLASAALTVGDSGSVAQESAMLGVPSVFVSSFAGRTAPIEELEHTYGLIQSFKPSESDKVIDAIKSLSRTPSDEFERRRMAMLRDKVDLTSWYLRLLDRIVGTSGISAPSRG